MKKAIAYRTSWLSGIILLVSIFLQACGNDTNLSLSTTATVPATSGTIVSVATTTASTAATATTAVAATVAATQAPSNTTVAASVTGTTAVAVATSGGVASTTLPRFEPVAKCPFKLAKDQVEGPNLQCGFMIVPEEHSKPKGKTIKLATAILKSGATNSKKPPVIYLQGGPGGNNNFTLEVFGGSNYPINNLVKDQDVIVFDQRGVGFSEPSLFCKEIDELAHQDLDKVIHPEESNRRGIDAAFKCRDRLVGQGINLAAYNSAENASDVEDIRVALGYSKVSLYGTSYGTRLALTMMRDHPQGIQSVILDSTYLPQSSLDIDVPANADRAINELFKACAANSQCNQDYPNLKDSFSKAFAQLNQKPQMVKIKDAVTNQTYNVAVDGNALVSVIFSMLYSTEVIPILPAIITTAQAGRLEIVAAILPDILFQERDISEAMYYSVQCSEETPFENPNDLATAAKNVLPEINASFVPGSQAMFTTCAKWPVAKPNPIENQPVKSDIPTLVLSGQFDPITPPSEGQEATRTLSKSFYVLFPNSGHVPSIVSAPGGNCGASVVRSFLANPTTKPDSSCTAQLSVTFLPKSNVDLLINQLKQSNP